MSYIYIIGTVFFTLYGQIILKWRIIKYGNMPDEFLSKIYFLFKLLLDPHILSGFLSAFVASFFWMAAMTKFELSHAYPIIVGGLAICTTFIAILLLKEPIGFYKFLGVLFIIFGIYFIGKSQ